MKEYPCELSKTGTCQYGGGKRFNYGFVSGTASYCRKSKRFIYNLLFQKDIKCPLIKNQNIQGAEVNDGR